MIKTYLFFSLGWGLKMFRDAIKTNYVDVKATLGIPDSWNWYCNPAVSWHNKDINWIWTLLTPISDLWHTLASLFLLCFGLAVYKKKDMSLIQLGLLFMVAIIFGNIVWYLIK